MKHLKRILLSLFLFSMLFSAVACNASGSGDTDLTDTQIFIRFSQTETGENPVLLWEEGYDYIGIAVSKTAPEEASEYTWTRFTDYVGEPQEKQVFIKYSTSSNGANFVSEWNVGYNYIGVAQATVEPTNSSDYTWTKFTNYTEPNKQVYIRYSKNSDGSGYIDTWLIGYNYIGVAQAETRPTNKDAYVWTKFTDYTEPTIPEVVEKNVFIKYSKYSDGTDFVNNWSVGYNYIGIAQAETEPTNKTNYDWSKFTDYVEPTIPEVVEKEVYIKYSKNADGSDYVNDWAVGYNYIGIAQAETEPTNKADYDWKKFTDYVEPVIPEPPTMHAFVKYSKYSDGADFISNWEMGYDYVGVACAETEPTSKTEYTWTKFYNYTPPTESIYIKYSKFADGTEYISNWQNGYNYVGVAHTDKEPTDKTGYTWSIINQLEGQEKIHVRYAKSLNETTFVETWTKGYDYVGIAKAVDAPLRFSEYTWTEFKYREMNNYYIKYSKNADGTDYKSTWENGYDYIGVANADVDPTDKSGYVWTSINKAQVTNNYYIAYSTSLNGTEYQTEYFEDSTYIGVYYGVTTPTKKTDYTWSCYKPDPVKPSAIKILAIGNSFSDDATEYLWKVYNDAGYQKVVIGNLYIGGCSLDTHWSNMQSNANAYDYRKNVSDNIVTTPSTSILTALNQEQWDIVTIQQSSGVSGDASSYKNLQNVINYIKTNEPGAKIYWHMTWAYQGDSTHGDFYRYMNNQVTMYNSIVDVAKKLILTNPDISGIIPSGTTIQNLRNSELGDTLTRDGYHLSYDVGRYAAALTWLRTIYQDDIKNIDVLPSNSTYALAVLNAMNMIKEAVNSAYETPFAITPVDSLHNLKYLTMTDTDKTFLTNNGYDPNNYDKIDLEWTLHGYYNPQDTNIANTFVIFKDASNSPQFNCTRRLSRTELPNGSLICLTQGFQYRPDGFNLFGRVNERPDIVKTGGIVTVDDAWWGGWASRGFNLGVLNTTRDITEADNANLVIYVPKTIG